ncbi:MAG TPA: EAL domain-containing protein, partial [Oxalicibacterium sp.]|nr:EAL domain-containing protein [Oxalicibacterium sp.]
MVVLGGAVFWLGLRTVSHYANERIQEDLERNSHELYNICDNALQTLLVDGLADSSAEVRLRKGNTLGKMEEYARQHDLQILVYDDRHRILLQHASLPAKKLLFGDARHAQPFVRIKYGGNEYYAVETGFELWQWHIVLAKDGKLYTQFASTILRSYVALGIIILIVSAMLILYFRRVVHKPIHTIIASIQDNGMPNYKGIYEFEFLSDVIREAKLKEQEKQIEMSYQASHDELTGLINRREFERRLRSALDDIRAQPGAHTILYLDLDQFKIINDTCGHHAGDALLQQLTRLLKDKLRSHDVLARLGGDEFGVLLLGCPSGPALRVAESLRQTVSEFRFAWKDKLFVVGVSIGLLTFSDNDLGINEILSIVDGACYIAKDKGRNRIHVYHPGDDELTERKGQMDWVTRISAALEDDRMVLYRQTILPLPATDDSVDHFEVLLRMRDEEGKLLPPLAFLPAAERYKLMPAIDFWVVKNAFEHVRDYCTDSRVRTTCSINLSGATLCEEQLVGFILEQFKLTGIAPTSICFELTETTAITNLDSAATLIRELKQIGCRFALDDFGSGMSSFGYLKTLPVDYIKIDGSFVKDMLHDDIDRAMVEAINNIGHVMGMQTIAEFVEDESIRQALEDMGVNFAQGYGVGRPEPLNAAHREAARA